jgi:hypothetical protein
MDAREFHPRRALSQDQGPAALKSKHRDENAR